MTRGLLSVAVFSKDKEHFQFEYKNSEQTNIKENRQHRPDDYHAFAFYSNVITFSAARLAASIDNKKRPTLGFLMRKDA